MNSLLLGLSLCQGYPSFSSQDDLGRKEQLLVVLPGHHCESLLPHPFGHHDPAASAHCDRGDPMNPIVKTTAAALPPGHIHQNQFTTLFENPMEFA